MARALALTRHFGETEAQLALMAYARTSSLFGVALVLAVDLLVQIVRRARLG
jgi:hypothetical protein